ncbi:MAG: hypothetical protein QF744_15050 [SAR202 cluster bacterium]|nr:hypothetical protein [SAR202 cluster bacterium]
MTKPSFKPTDDERKLVEQMTAVGIPQESVSLVVRDGIDKKTLRKHFRRELDTAKIKANAKIGGTLFNKAIGGDTTAAIFWAKTQMGWKETDRLEHGVDGSLAALLKSIDGSRIVPEGE